MRGFEFHDVAAANGVAFTRNHNVLARVFTTIHLTRLIASKAPELWAVALAHADKPLLAAPMASAPDMTPASENAVKAAPAAALPCERDLRTQGLRSFQGRLVNADVRALHPSPSEPSPDEQRNDEVISGRDRELCAAFHAAPWEEKPPILTKMNDPRLREFGRRLLAFERRDLLSRAELTHHFHWLRRRLMGDFRVPWRTLPDAIAEITAARASGRLDNEAQRRLDEYLAICEARLAWRQLWR